MPIELIGFDADDTLWQTEIHYLQAQQALGLILSHWDQAENIDEILYQIHINNIPYYGYGIKSYILSMIETALHVSAGEIRGEQIEQILKIGKKMLDLNVVLLPHIEETLISLSSNFRLMILTKGDLLDQTRKVKQSGLASFFFAVEILVEKTSETYASVLEKYQVNPNNFLMVGNSIRSDVEPVLQLGGTAVHIPASTTWKHELVSEFDTSQKGFFTLEHIGQLPELIVRINHAD